MSLGLVLSCRWFAQQIEMLVSPTGRRWDAEANVDLVTELEAKISDLKMALELGSNIKAAAVEVGSVAMMLAYNAEKGIGNGPSVRKLHDVESKVEKKASKPVASNNGDTTRRGPGRPRIYPKA